MSKRMNERLAKLRADGRTGLYIYVTAGCPSAEATVDIVSSSSACRSPIPWRMAP